MKNLHIILIRSLLTALILVGSQIPQLSLANGEYCAQIHQPVQEFHNVDLSQPLHNDVVQALHAIQIMRPGFLGPGELGRFEFGGQPVNLIVGQAPVTELKPGILIDPASRGTVVTPVDSKITPEKSESLFTELEKAKTVADLILFSRPQIDQNMLAEIKEEGGSYEFLPGNPYAVVDNGIFIDKFINHLVRESQISEKQQDYVRTALSEMIAVTQKAKGPSFNKHVIGIRMRWKTEGKGADYDIVHTDGTGASIATTLTLIGAGTEVFYETGHTLEVRGVPTNMISNILSESSGHPAVKHRASTQQARRIVLLIFWN